MVLSKWCYILKFSKGYFLQHETPMITIQIINSNELLNEKKPYPQVLQRKSQGVNIVHRSMFCGPSTLHGSVCISVELGRVQFSKISVIWQQCANFILFKGHRMIFRSTRLIVISLLICKSSIFKLLTKWTSKQNQWRYVRIRDLHLVVKHKCCTSTSLIYIRSLYHRI